MQKGPLKRKAHKKKADSGVRGCGAITRRRRFTRGPEVGVWRRCQGGGNPKFVNLVGGRIGKRKKVVYLSGP